MRVRLSLIISFALLNSLHQSFNLVFGNQFGSALLDLSLECKTILSKLFSFYHDVFFALLQFLHFFV